MTSDASQSVAWAILPAGPSRNVFFALTLLCIAASGQTLQGTQPLTLEADFADRMLTGMDNWLLRELAAAPAHRDTRSTPPEEKRKRFAKIIGVVDHRIPFEAPALDASLAQS